MLVEVNAGLGAIVRGAAGGAAAGGKLGEGVLGVVLVQGAGIGEEEVAGVGVLGDGLNEIAGLARGAAAGGVEGVEQLAEHGRGWAASPWNLGSDRIINC